MMNTLKYINQLFALLIFLFLSACSSQANTQTTAKTLQPNKPASIESTSSIEISPSIAPSFTPTATRKITETPPNSPFSSVTPTLSVPAELTRQATTLLQTQIASFSPACQEGHPGNPLISPHNNLFAFSCGYKRDQVLKVLNKSGEIWVVPFKEYVSDKFITEGHTPMGGLFPVHWTKDERYLFFVSAIAFDGGGTCFYGEDGQALYRIDVTTGIISTTLSPLIGPDGYGLSFSPDGRWLAYTTGIPTILNIQTGETFVLQEGNLEVGNFAWSPDSSYLVYATCQGSADYSDTPEKSAIRIFSFETYGSETILEKEKTFLWINIIDGNRLEINNGFNYYERWYFDWSSRKLISRATTPRP